MTVPSPPPPKGAAFFDMDETLIAGNSGRIYARSLRHEKRFGFLKLLRVGVLLFLYRLSLVDIVKVSQRVIRSLAGDPEQPAIDHGETLFTDNIVPIIFPEAVAMVEDHRERGDTLVIASASSPYVVNPLAKHLGIEHVLCTRPIATEGRFTGDFEAPICFGEGKLEWARRFCEQHGLDLANCSFYSDSYSDLPLLEAVGHPVAVNPDLRLLPLALRRGWPVRQLQRPG